jgi:hypothetical protein
MDLRAFVNQLIEDGSIQALATDVGAQFGPANREYLGATILPERLVPANRGEESQIRYRTVIANDGTRYSPVQLKTTGQLVGSFSYELGHQDIGSQLDAAMYDALIDLLQRNVTMDAAATIIRYVDNTVVIPLVEVIEKQRWQAIVNAEVVRVGDNGYSETVAYPNPTGHRIDVAGDWFDDTYDPFDDIVSVIDMMEDKGLIVNRIVASRRIKTTLLRNEQISRRFARVRVLSDADLFGRMSAAELDSGFASEGIPAIETYDLSFNTQDGARIRFLPDDVMVFLAETGRDEEIVEPEQQGGEPFRLLENVLGYTAIGRASGQATAGRVVRVETFDNKPPRIEFEGWQTSLPIIAEPEAVAVLRDINPAE